MLLSWSQTRMGCRSPHQGWPEEVARYRQPGRLPQTSHQEDSRTIRVSAGKHRGSHACVRTATSALRQQEVLHSQVPHRQLQWRWLCRGVWPSMWDGQVLPLSLISWPPSTVRSMTSSLRSSSAPVGCPSGLRETPSTSHPPPMVMWLPPWWTSSKAQAAKTRQHQEGSGSRVLSPRSRSRPRRPQHQAGSWETAWQPLVAVEGLAAAS